jgi:hypothetical protein
MPYLSGRRSYERLGKLLPVPDCRAVVAKLAQAITAIMQPEFSSNAGQAYTSVLEIVPDQCRGCKIPDLLC